MTDLASQIADRFAGRWIHSGDLATLYGLKPKQAGKVMATLIAADKIAEIASNKMGKLYRLRDK